MHGWVSGGDLPEFLRGWARRLGETDTRAGVNSTEGDREGAPAYPRV